MTKDEALKLALDALEKVTKEMLACRDALAEHGCRPTSDALHQRLWDSSFDAYTNHAIPAAGAINEALAAPVQEPVGEMRLSQLIDGMVVPVVEQNLPAGTKLYTTPPAAQPAQKHHVNMMLYAQDAAETDKPWERWQYADKDGNWYDCVVHPSWAYPAEYRRKKPAAQRQWVGLTDEEIDKTYETQVWDAKRSYARAIETKLKEKNT